MEVEVGPNLRNAKDGSPDTTEGAKRPRSDEGVRRQASGIVGTEASLRDWWDTGVCTGVGLSQCIREEVV